MWLHMRMNAFSCVFRVFVKCVCVCVSVNGCMHDTFSCIFCVFVKVVCVC